MLSLKYLVCVSQDLEYIAIDDRDKLNDLLILTALIYLQSSKYLPIY